MYSLTDVQKAACAICVATLGAVDPVMAMQGPMGDVFFETTCRFANFVFAEGDLDSDGSPDYLVASECGLAAYSGITHQQLWIRSVAEYGPSYIVRPFADVNGDGADDLLLCDNRSVAEIQILSGMDGGQLVVQNPNHPTGGEFVANVEVIGDLDGDSIPEYVIADPDWASGGGGTGYIGVYSGSTSSLIRSVVAQANEFRLGASACRLEDVNGDLVPDFVLGATGNPNSGSHGRVVAISGQDGTRLWTSVSSTTQGIHERYGESVARIGDCNGNGSSDLAVSASGLQGHTGMPGVLEILDGSSGSLIHSIIGPGPDTHFGLFAKRLGDLNGDGTDEVSTVYYQNATWQRPYTSVIYDVRNRKRLWAQPALDPVTGGTYFPFFDRNLDGYRDFVRGEGRSIANVTTVSLAVFSGGFQEVISQLVCQAATNSSGSSTSLAAVGSSDIATSNFSLVADGMPPGSFGYLIGSLGTQAPVSPPGAFGFLCLGGGSPIVRLKQTVGLESFGTLESNVDLENFPLPSGTTVAVVQGDSWAFQLWYRDGVSSNFSDAVLVTFE